MMANDRNDSGSGDPQQRSGGRRRSRRGRGGGDGNRSQGPPQGGKGGGAPQGGKSSSGGQKGGGKGSQGGRRNRKRRKPSHGGTTGFWGDPAKLPNSPADIRITDEPAAVPRSLGPPPLPGHEQIAVHYFTAVYDRSVSTAGALAAAGGLIDPNALVDEDD